MHTGEPQGGAARDDRRNQGDAHRIAIGGGDDQIARIQLAARWSELFAPDHGDSLPSMLRRFRTAFDFLDSVTHGVEPAEIEPPQPNASTPAPTAAPAAVVPADAPPAEPRPEPRPW